MVNNTSCCDVVRVEELGWGLVWWGGRWVPKAEVYVR